MQQTHSRATRAAQRTIGLILGQRGAQLGGAEPAVLYRLLHAVECREQKKRVMHKLIKCNLLDHFNLAGSIEEALTYRFGDECSS